jgi:hypothetical protein
MRSALPYPHRFCCAPTRSSNNCRLCRFMALHFLRRGAAKSDTLAGIADMPPAGGGSGRLAYDPGADVNREADATKIPQCSRVPPRPDVLSFRESTGGANGASPRFRMIHPSRRKPMFAIGRRHLISLCCGAAAAWPNRPVQRQAAWL